MTSPPPPPPDHDPDGPVDETDALLSAVLDDMAAPDELARVQADPALRRRLEDFRAIRGRLSAPVEPLPPDQVDAMVSAALSGADDAGADRTPVPLAPRRAAPRRWEQRRPWLVAAAVVAFLALGTLAVPGALDRLGSRDDDASTATAVLEGASDSDDTGEEETAADAPTTAEADLGRSPALEGPDLGVAVSVEELVRRAEAAPFTTSTRDDSAGADAAGSLPPSTSPVDLCPELVGVDDASRTTVATGVVGDEAFVVVLVGPDGEDPGTVRVARAVDCVVVLERTR